jgi:hypothetical protein
MIKKDLREQGYSVDERFPSHSKVNTIWAILTLIFIIGTYGSFFLITSPNALDRGAGKGPAPPDDLFIEMLEATGRALTLGLFDSEVAGYLIFAVLMLILYLVIKLFLTILICRRSDSIKFKLLESKGLPVCLCREALRVWQTVLIYLAPFVLTYSLYFYLCLRYINKPAFMVMFFFMLFFLVFDLTLVLYVLCVKIKDRPDYISIDHHIYGYTVCKKTYVKFSRRKKI